MLIVPQGSLRLNLVQSLTTRARLLGGQWRSVSFFCTPKFKDNNIPSAWHSFGLVFTETVVELVVVWCAGCQRRCARKTGHTKKQHFPRFAHKQTDPIERAFTDRLSLARKVYPGLRGSCYHQTVPIRPLLNVVGSFLYLSCFLLRSFSLSLSLALSCSWLSRFQIPNCDNHCYACRYLSTWYRPKESCCSQPVECQRDYHGRWWTRASGGKVGNYKQYNL